jgi:hypothetical protein
MQTSTLASLLLLAVSCVSCTTLPGACSAGTSAGTQETLFFGTSRPGSTVSDLQWRGFVDEVIATRFPQGFTLSEAQGQWRNADGSTTREGTHVLHIVHAGGASADQAVTDIVRAYKQRFEQEAVLRTRSPVCHSF